MTMARNGTEIQPNRAEMEAVWCEIADLERQSVGKLRERYLEVFGEPPGSHHRLALIRRLAWRLQALAEGDLSDRARDRAQSLARDADLRLTAPRWITTQRTIGGTGGGHPGDPRLPA